MASGLLAGIEMSNSSFNDFIKKQAEVAPEEAGLSMEEELALWRTNLQNLSTLVHEALKDAVQEGSARIDVVPINLHEEQLGSYEAKQLKIAIGRHVITLTPVGTFLIGARGRVDMKGPFGMVKFVIVPPASTGVRVLLNPNKKDKVFVPPENWVWKIATPPPRISYQDLDIESFRSALVEVMGG